MKSSDSIANLADALVRANLLITNPTKTQPVQAGAKRYSFAPLPELLDDLRPILQAHGLAVLQPAEGASGGVNVSTLILHDSGEWLELGPLFMPCAGDAQSIGSATTYGRRYSLCAALGIAADEDDDGAKAKKSPAVHATTKMEKGKSELDAAGASPAGTREQSTPDSYSLTNPTAAPSVAGDPPAEPGPSSGSTGATSEGTGREVAPGVENPVSSETSGPTEAHSTGEEPGTTTSTAGPETSEGVGERETIAYGEGVTAPSDPIPSELVHVHGAWSTKKPEGGAMRTGWVRCTNPLPNGQVCGYGEKRSRVAEADILEEASA